jgi:hypothetical protein
VVGLTTGSRGKVPGNIFYNNNNNNNNNNSNNNNNNYIGIN